MSKHKKRSKTSQLYNSIVASQTFVSLIFLVLMLHNLQKPKKKPIHCMGNRSKQGEIISSGHEIKLRM